MSADQRRRARILAVGGAVVAALAVWLVAELALGLDLRSPVFEGSVGSFDIGPVAVAVSALLPSLAGWAFLAVLERFTARAATIWLVIAVLALLGSLAMPLSGTGLEAAQRGTLVAMHLVVGGVLIPTLFATSRSARDQKEGSHGSFHAA